MKASRKLKIASGVALAALLVTALAAVAQEPVVEQNPWAPANRDQWQRPEEVMDELRLRSGSAVADVGCGEGYFTYHLAERVGPQGRVYAEDIEEKLVREIGFQTLSKWLVQVRARVGAPEDPYLPNGRLDAILVVIAYHEMREHDAMTEAFYRALKPGGRVGIIEYEAPENQPRDESYERHQIPAATVREEITRHGFRFVKNAGRFAVPGRDKGQYFLVFEKPED